jgi:hypothetical protein
LLGEEGGNAGKLENGSEKNKTTYIHGTTHFPIAQGRQPGGS